MEQRIEEGRASGDSLIIRREWVPLADISPNLVRAVVVAEDYRFRQHQGIDWVSLAEEVQWSGDEQFSWTNPSDLRALAEALGHVWANRDEIRGRSTITQQLAKNLFFGTDRSLLRKAMEYVVARRLERRLDKDRILELYLNAAEWGPGVFGAEAAARTYFGRSAASLGLEQAAALAATLPHPLTSNPAHRPGRMAWRRDLILERLRPATGVPTEPLPLPPPRLDLGPDLPDVVVPPIDTGGADRGLGGHVAGGYRRSPAAGHHGLARRQESLTSLAFFRARFCRNISASASSTSACTFWCRPGS
jgi:monofunctional glycosyltransferase